MGNVVKGIASLAACYAAWGAIAICEPTLVSEEAAEKSKVLRAVKDATDGIVVGCKFLVAAPFIALGSLRNISGK